MCTRIKESKGFQQKIKWVDKDNQRLFVQSKKGKVYPVILSDKLCTVHLEEGQRVLVKIFNGQWVATDTVPQREGIK